VELPQSLLTTTQIYVDPVQSVDPKPDPPTPPVNKEPSTYPVVALGGTFDHLHAGHKILLSMAAWIADTKIIVGVTGALLRFQ